MRIPAGKEQPDLILGEKFIPGSDHKHFCKPSDVIVLKTGEFFVSDGYVCLICSQLSMQIHSMVYSDILSNFL